MLDPELDSPSLQNRQEVGKIVGPDAATIAWQRLPSWIIGHFAQGRVVSRQHDNPRSGITGINFRIARMVLDHRDQPQVYCTAAEGPLDLIIAVGDVINQNPIIGQPSDRIESILGYVDEPELIHRDNLVVL